MIFEGYPGGTQAEITRSGEAKGRSVGQYSFIQETPLSKQDTGYSIQDTGIEE